MISRAGKNGNNGGKADKIKTAAVYTRRNRGKADFEAADARNGDRKSRGNNFPNAKIKSKLKKLENKKLVNRDGGIEVGKLLGN